MTATITYKTQYGKTAKITRPIEDTWQEITDMRDAALTIVSVQFKGDRAE